MMFSSLDHVKANYLLSMDLFDLEITYEIYALDNFVNIGSEGCLLPDNIESLPILIWPYRPWGSTAFTYGRYHNMFTHVK